MPAQVSELIKVVSLFYPVPVQAQDFLREHCVVKAFRKGEYLLRPGEVCTTYHFIYQGVIRAFIRQGEKEVTTWISCANEIVTSIYSMHERTPSIEYIQVIREAVLVELSADKLEELLQLVPEMNILLRRLLTVYYQDAEIRSFIARIPSAAARCRYYLDVYAEKAPMIPKKYIASFLGIREETLSRMLSRDK